MAPRRRPRKRNTRMDPAIEQMSMYGFPEKLVRQKMKTLLEIYDGEWVFIETDNYAVLLEAILEEINEDNNNEESSMVDKSILEEEKKEIHESIPDISSSSKDAKQAEPDDENSIRDSGRLENQMVVEDQEKRSEPIEVKKEIVSFPVVATVVNSPLMKVNLPKIRFKPSYGWISDSDDDHDFIKLEPIPRSPATPSPTIDDRKQRKRKTRPHIATTVA